jgi:hypothetical protein
MWHKDTGQEITVSSAAEQATRAAEGFVTVPWEATPPAPSPPVEEPSAVEDANAPDVEEKAEKKPAKKAKDKA